MIAVREVFIIVLWLAQAALACADATPQPAQCTATTKLSTWICDDDSVAILQTQLQKESTKVSGPRTSVEVATGWVPRISRLALAAATHSRNVSALLALLEGEVSSSGTASPVLFAVAPVALLVLGVGCLCMRPSQPRGIQGLEDRQPIMSGSEFDRSGIEHSLGGSPASRFEPSLGGSPASRFPQTRRSNMCC